uniref:Uncharacterized protein n=1 Tax=Solanum tuberosum TaxID=4113 RepID=M1BN61_SOLTU
MGKGQLYLQMLELGKEERLQGTLKISDLHTDIPTSTQQENVSRLKDILQWFIKQLMVIAISFWGLYSFSVPKGKGQSPHKNGMVRIV